MEWKKIRKYIPIIGIALFIYLLIKLNIVKVFKQIGSLNLSFLPIVFVFIIIFFIFQTLKWFVIARKQKIEIPFKEAFKTNLIANFYGFVTPAKIGGVIRIDYLRKYSESIGKSVSNFIIDKILDTMSLFILIIGFGFLFYKEIKIIPLNYLYIFIIIFLVIITLFFVFYKKESSKFFLRFIYKRFIPERIKEKTKSFFDSFYKDMPSIKFLFFVFSINIISWIINYFVIYLIGLSLSINIGFIPFLAILPISTLIAQIPITISGLGIRELTMINLFKLFKVDSVKVFSMSILAIIFVNIIPSIIVMFFLLKKEANKKQ